MMTKMNSNELRALVRTALDNRRALLAQCAAEDTDCMRLVNGISEGIPGLTVDRYGEVLLIQTQERAELSEEEVRLIHSEVVEILGTKLELAWNVRGDHALGIAVDYTRAFVGRELGIRYDVRPRTRGNDPYLFLDFRNGRRRMAQLAAGKSVLNLFSYTCGIGVVAQKHGAKEVWNVDFSKTALEIGKANAALNACPISESYRYMEADVLPTMRQLAGLPWKGRRVATRGAPVNAEKRGKVIPLKPRTFDIVVLDPPRWAKTPFGAIDVVRDYPSLLKPAIACTEKGGVVIATNHVPTVSREEFERIVRRTGEKMERPFASVEVLGPEADFPSFDGQPPLKVAIGVVA